MKQFLPFKFKFYQYYFNAKNAIIHVKNAMDLLRINALNAIHLYMKIHCKKMMHLSNVFQNTIYVKILHMFMLKLKTTAKIKTNAFLNAKITLSLMDFQKFARIVMKLIISNQFFQLISHYVCLLAILRLFLHFRSTHQWFLAINVIIHVKNAMDPLTEIALNAIQLYLKIHNKKMTLLSNVF